MKLVIGLVGEIHSGKETFTNLLKQILADQRTEHFRTSGILYEMLDILGVKATRENLQTMAIQIDDEEGFGKGTLARAIGRRMRKSTADIVVYDCIRWNSDLELVRTFNHRIVYITADARTRWQRCKECKEKVGEEFVTFEQFRASERRSTETDIPILAKAAHMKIVNNGDIDRLRRYADSFARSLVKL